MRAKVRNPVATLLATLKTINLNCRRQFEGRLIHRSLESEPGGAFRHFNIGKLEARTEIRTRRACDGVFRKGLQHRAATRFHHAYRTQVAQLESILKVSIGAASGPVRNETCSDDERVPRSLKLSQATRALHINNTNLHQE